MIALCKILLLVVNDMHDSFLQSNREISSGAHNAHCWLDNRAHVQYSHCHMLKVASLNINRISNKVFEINDWLLNSDIDVLCLVETHAILNSDIPPFPDFDLFCEPYPTCKS